MHIRVCTGYTEHVQNTACTDYSSLHNICSENGEFDRYCRKEKSQKRIEVREKRDSPGEVLYVHQHGVLLHMQLISQQQQLHQLLI